MRSLNSSLAEHVHDDVSSVRAVAVLPEVDALPRAEHELSGSNRDLL